jgi:hypothetical protein
MLAAVTSMLRHRLCIEHDRVGRVRHLREHGGQHRVGVREEEPGSVSKISTPRAATEATKSADDA